MINIKGKFELLVDILWAMIETTVLFGIIMFFAAFGIFVFSKVSLLLKMLLIISLILSIIDKVDKSDSAAL